MNRTQQRGDFSGQSPLCAILAVIATLFLALAGFNTSALAVEPIVIGPSDEKIDITLLGEFYERRGDKLSVETAARRRRHRRAHDRFRQDAWHQSELGRLRALQPDRQADHALADGAEIRHRRFPRAEARPRRAAHHQRDAVAGLQARAQRGLRSPRHLPAVHRAGDHGDVHRRACLGVGSEAVPVLAREFRQAAAGYQPVSRHSAGSHGASRDLPDRDLRGESQGDLSSRGAGRLVGACLSLRRFRLLA